MEHAVFIHGVSHWYGEVEILHNLDFELEEGGFVCVIGRSGCGKSTLLRLVSGIEKPRGGEIRADRRIAVCFQEPRLIPWLGVEKNVRLGMKGDRKKLRKDALAALRDVGLEEKALAWPQTLSGGQAQRVSLARALIRRPRLLLLDEPFGALDAITRREMQDLLAMLVREHALSVVMVTHDTDEARRLAGRIFSLEGGKLHPAVFDDYIV
ncbi:MAG: ABC transporter ATP-binding protein [Treponema sp.]|jgi:sulfonate transport system ATP-binding protein|nr:ABC transporter ATP-binding protein [Treponema sp.]